MRLPLVSLGLSLVLGAAPASSAAAGGAARRAGPAAAQGKAASPGQGPYAVLRSAPAATPTCRLARHASGELRAALYAPETADCPVARVAGGEVALGELAAALAEAHTGKGSRARQGAKARGMDFKPTLDRIVDVRLIVEEARDMGLVDQPEYRRAREEYRASALRTALQEQAAAGVEPDAAEVEKLFQAAVKEWKLRSVKFGKEEDARQFRQAVAQGGDFDALARAAVAEKKAQGGEPGFVAARELVPELAHEVSRLQPGQLGEPVKLAAGWVVLRLEGERHPEDAQARAAATAQARGSAQHRAVRALHEALVKKYARVDEALLAQLDFEAGGEPAFRALLQDGRALVQIQGEAPLTVAELTQEISQKFFHGIADPIREHRVNRGKQEAYERLLGSRLFLKEARERKLDQSEAYRRKVEGYDRVLAFNAFLERVLVPEVRVTEKEVQALYEKRKKQLFNPAMFRLEGQGFASAAAAQAALGKLAQGTDLEWLRASAEGRLPPEEQGLRLDGALVSANTLPASLAKALTGAVAGDLRLYAADDGAQHYVVRVKEHIPPSVRPYLDVREKLAREVEAEKIAGAVRDYAARLRQVQKVDVLLTRISG